MSDRTAAISTVRGILTDHGLIGHVRDVKPGAHSTEIHLSFVTESNWMAEQVSTLLRSTLPSRYYAVTPPEYGHHGLGRSVTVMARGHALDVMGPSGLIHREDARLMSDNAVEHMVTRRAV